MDRVKALHKDVKRYLDHQKFEYEIAYTKYAKHGTELARKGVEKGFDCIVAVGGDGSVNDIIHGLYGSGAILGIIPKGSGNGLARSLAIPLKESSAIKVLNRFKLKEIDIGNANGHLFSSNAGVGFDALVTDRFRSNIRRGFMAYIWIILKNIWTYKPKTWKVNADEKTFESTSFMITASNASQLGYGFKIAPESSISDSYFHLVIIKKFPTLFAALIALKAFLGKTHKSRYVKTIKARKISIQHPELTKFQIDGESLSCNGKVEIEMMPKKLSVLV